MRRHLPRLLLTGALLSPVTLYALGLGEIRLNSSLNQPFDAEIELIAPTPEELSNLKVGLASQEMFSRYGIDRPSYLSNFDFSISRTRDGRSAIRVKSNRSVTEPFVTLLVEASWPRGRLLREYTVLLDPPVFMPSQSQAPAPVTTPQSGARTEGRIERAAPVEPPPAAPVPLPEPRPEPPVAAAPADEPAPVVEEPASAPVATAGGEYTVERNDTLWKIANSINPGSPSTVNRTMIALYRANPEAFSGNINRLRAGAVLRVPEFADIDAISGSEASQEVARQTAEWSGALATDVVEEPSRLRLVTPEEAPETPAPAPAQPERVAGATPQSGAPGAPATDDKRLQVTSPDLAVAQQNVDDTPAQPATPAETSTETPAAEAPEAATEPPVQPAPVQRPRPAQPPVQEAPTPSLSDRIAEFWWAPVALGLLLVIGLIITVVRRRRDAEPSTPLGTLPPLDFEPPAARRAKLAAAPMEEEDRADAFSLDEESAADEYEAPAPVTIRRSEPAKAASHEQADAPLSASRTTADDTLSSETAVRFDQQDALAEADFHMAYGLYDQAADLVKIALDREPGRRDLRLKLLEIYFVWGNKDLFLDTARELHRTRDEAPAGEWDKVVIMGKQIAPADSMFEGESSGGMDLVDVNLEGGENRVDVDLFAEPTGEHANAAGLDLEFTSGERPAPKGDSDLDFLLDDARGEQDGDEDESTREIDPLARTQETPTIESPMLNRSDATIREAPRTGTPRQSGEQTAELSIDDLGLDVNAIDNSGSLEDTTSLEKDDGATQIAPPLRDDEMTQLAPSLGSMERTMEAPRLERDNFDIESTGTIYIDQVDLSGGDTVEQPRPDADSTASMKAPAKLDLDLDHLSDGAFESHDTVRHPRGGALDDDDFSSDVFADRGAQTARIDLDVGEPLSGEDREPTNRQITTEMELSELEPVTMSEVGTKLDLARAYMDMGDPDGARSILDEVVSEGNPTQKQEAQRLLESIR